ncbi:hypothetical protein Ancab_022244 [Ancistrocladus abbreviatus]
MTIGEVLFGTGLQFLLDKVADSSFIADLLRDIGVDDAFLHKFQVTLCAVDALLIDAEEKQFTNQAVKKWLGHLKDVVYEAQDILDEIATEDLRNSIEPQPPSKRIKVIPFSSASADDWKRTFASNLRDIHGRLEYMVNQKVMIGLIERTAPFTVDSQMRLTSSFVDESNVYGRNEEKQQIIDLLLSRGSGGGRFGVVAIVGMGGLGKTTLAQTVYNDDMVKECFDFRSWVCVSDHFDIVQVTRTILESVTDRSYDIRDLNRLQEKLRDEIKGKRFLIVLDDMWNESDQMWELLRAPFSKAAQDSKIIVTTRSDRVASVMEANVVVNLKQLSDADGWLLFSRYAFRNDSPSAHARLVDIGHKIVARCKGLPLALKTLGSLLHSRLDSRQWEDVLNSNIWKSSERRNDILPALSLSYFYLPFHLKRCFAHCSIFPKDHRFRKEELVRFWMAENLVEPRDSNQRLENVGNAYLDELLSRSFFNPFISDTGNVYYVMHDLIHDLAQFVFGDFYEQLGENQPLKSFERVRHVSFYSGESNGFNMNDAISRFKNLRTFLSLGPCDNVPCGILPQLCRLRVMSVSGCVNIELPSTIGNLKQLRFLDLSFTDIKELPKSICDLLNLQTLLLTGCYSFMKLPDEMWKLVSLRYLANRGTSMEKMPMQMGKLRNLQTLDMFVVGKHEEPTLGELGGLQNLEGKLVLKGLENVEKVEYAHKAGLKEKGYLDALTLEFDLNKSYNSEKEQDVLDNLMPHKYLKQLTISDFGGMRLSDWLADRSFYVVSLSLIACAHCDSLPPLGQLPCLKSLRVEEMKNLQFVGVEVFGSCSDPICSLEEMLFIRMEAWEIWDAKNISFPCLKKLTVKECPRLRGCLPEDILLQTRLRRVKIRACPVLGMGSCPMDGLPTSLERFQALNVGEWGFPVISVEMMNLYSSLEILRIDDDVALVSFAIGLLPKLRVLCFSRCKNLEKIYIPERVEHDHHGGLKSLEKLEIEGCPKLEAVARGGLPAPNLTYFTIMGCENLKSLPLGMQAHLTSLQHLIILDCPRVEPMAEGDHFPSTLVCLKLDHFEQLTSSWSDATTAMRSFFYRCQYLKQLSLGDWNSVECFPFPQGQGSSLIQISIRRFRNLKRLDVEALQSLTSLQNLLIFDCPELQDLPRDGLPSSLRCVRM